MASQSAFSMLKRDDGVALITIDLPGENQNTLKAEFAEQVASLIAEIEADPSLQGVVICSGKPGSFVAGADVGMLAACRSVDDAERLSLAGQQVFASLEQLTIPVVAAIDGACLGGGLELALACHYRICSEGEKTRLGVPEVQLGLLPGAGGTQRLPRLVGIAKALDLMLSGRQLRPKQALKMGLVDDVVPASILLDSAIELALQGKQRKRKAKRTLMERVLEGNPVGRNLLFSQASQRVQAKTHGNYPAPPRIIECVREGIERGMKQGLALEAQRFAELVMTPESAALRSIFFATTEMKKESGAGDAQPRPLRKVAVLGGDLMGGGIANVTATKAGLPVRIKDIRHEGLSNALRYSYERLLVKYKRRQLSKGEFDRQLARISATTDFRGLHDSDVVIEAVFEDLQLKHQMVADIERECRSDTVFATNTSSLPIHQIAANAQRPENVVGLHYFSPVDKMPLVEVIAHQATAPEAIATVVKLARQQGKTPIVVQDGAGFYVNRILALYVNEAAQLLLEGEPVEQLDQHLVQFGFPVGPFKLLDEVGIDVGSKIAPILASELGERFTAPDAFAKLINDGRLGRKVNKGFYQYKGKAKGKQVDSSVYTLLGIAPHASLSAEQIQQRCIAQMLNEAIRCLDEGIIASPRDGDIGAIFGIGFPPFLGGPFRYIDRIGAKKLLNQLQQLEKLHGARFTPSPRLVAMAEQGGQFYS